MLRLRRRPPLPLLPERWRATLTGSAAFTFLADPESDSLFVSDGWGVSFAALRLHCLDLGTGEHRAAVRTRHQGVSGMARTGDVLYAATDSRLFELRPDDLGVLRQWDAGLVAHAHRVVAAGGRLVLANWLRPTVGVFDSATGRTRRVKVGAQPQVVPYDGGVWVLAGRDGGMRRLDPARGRLADPVPTPPVSAAVGGSEVWGVLAGPPESGGGGDVTIVRGTDRVARLTGDTAGVRLPAAIGSLSADAAGTTLWCVAAEPSALYRVDVRSLAVTGAYGAAPGTAFRHVDAVAGVALATTVGPVGDAALTAYALP